MRLALVLTVALLAGCECNDEPPDPAPLPPPRSESNGLRASVAEVRRGLSTPPLEVSYVLEWVAPPTGRVDVSGDIQISNVWLLEPLEPAVVHFWDRSGTLVGEAIQRVILPDQFRDRSIAKREVRFLVDAPAAAASLSVALGRSGLETERALIP